MPSAEVVILDVTRLRVVMTTLTIEVPSARAEGELEDWVCQAAIRLNPPDVPPGVPVLVTPESIQLQGTGDGTQLYLAEVVYSWPDPAPAPAAPAPAPVRKGGPYVH